MMPLLNKSKKICSKIIICIYYCIHKCNCHKHTLTIINGSFEGLRNLTSHLRPQGFDFKGATFYIITLLL
jgi:hypothetical protein